METSDAVADFVQERQRRYAGDVEPLLCVPMEFWEERGAIQQPGVARL